MVPYFFEMRTLLDWICSDSSLSVTDWFKMEEIIQNIFDQRVFSTFSPWLFYIKFNWVVVSAKSGRRVGRPFREGSRPNQEVHQGWIALFSAHSNRDFPLFAILFGGYSGGEDTSVKIQVAIVYGECGTHFSVVCFSKKPPRVSVLNHHITKWFEIWF